MLPHEYVEETSLSLSPVAPPPPERRDGQRHLTILRVGALTIGGVRELCLVRNISAGGVMAHVYRKIGVGTEVEIEIRSDLPIRGKVVWERESNIGVAFNERIDVPGLLAASKSLGDGRRARSPRVQVNRQARLRCGEYVREVHACDVSQGGVKIETDWELPVDADVVVTLEGFRPLAGIVRWAHGGFAGINFLQVIPIGDLCEWLRAGDHSAER